MEVQGQGMAILMLKPYPAIPVINIGLAYSTRLALKVWQIKSNASCSINFLLGPRGFDIM